MSDVKQACLDIENKINDSISTFTTLNGVILHLTIRHRLNATIRQAAIRLSPCIGRSMMKVGILQDLLGVEFILRGL